MPESRGKGLKPPKVDYNLKFLGLYAFLGISFSYLKLTHGKPQWNPDFKENHMALVSNLNGPVNRDRRKSLIIFSSASCTYFTLQYLRVTVQFLFDSNKDTLVNEGPCWS